MAVTYIKTDQGITKSVGAGAPVHSGIAGDEYTNLSNGDKYVYTTAWQLAGGGTGTVTSVQLATGTGISLSGTNPITTSGTITITNSAPDQTVVLSDGTGISTSGTYPSFTITNTAPDQTVSLSNGTGISTSGTYPSFTITNTAPDQTVSLSNGTGISTSGTYPSFTITNTAPDQTVSLSNGTGISTSGTYPSFTITNTAPDQTVALTSGTGMSITGSYPSFTITNTAPDQTVALTSGTGISVTGTYPNFTIANTLTIPTSISTVAHNVKYGEAITIGQAVYVSSADGTNMIVSKASNTAESTSSKTMGLVTATGALNYQGVVVTEGLLAGLDTTGASAAGDPVWLGTNGNLIYGLINKPVAPDHLVFIGIVTRRNVSNGEIFVKVQNGFELQELHNVLINGLSDNNLLTYESSTQLWKNKTLGTVIGGAANQYVRGDGTTAIFPTTTGGGSSVTYYLNGGTSQGTIGGSTYYEMSKVAVIGSGADFSLTNTTGYIAQFITDVADPSLLNIPLGAWNFMFYFSASDINSSGSFYVELYKYDGVTFTLIADSSGSPELISNATSINLYTTSIAVPSTTLTVNDRLAVRIFVNTNGNKTITLYTEDNHLCQVITTFSSGINTLNGLSAQVQYFNTSTTGTDFTISSSTDAHTFNLPTASASNNGKLSSTDWTTFNGKVPSTRTISTDSPLSGGGDLSANRTLSIADAAADGTTKGAAAFTASDFNSASGVISLDYTNGQAASGSTKGFLTSSDWTTFNSKQDAFTGYDYEIHVSQVDGNDTTGNGDLLTPVASITKALTLVGSQRKTIIVHPGTYTESPSITVQYTTITGPGLIGGNIVIAGTVSTNTGCTISGIKMTNLTITTPTATGNVNILNCEISGTLTKSSNADYTVLRLCDYNAANITGAGLVAIFGGNPNFTTVNNASANVIIKSCTAVAPVLTAGTLSIVDSIVIAAVTNAFTSAAGTVTTLSNSQFLTSTLTTVAPVVLNGFYSIINCVFDKPSSTLVALSGTGGPTNSIDYFQYINADKFITQGGTSSQFVKGDGTLGTSVSGTVTSVSALTLGTTGTDLSSTVATGTTTPVITLNVPTASASNRGVLSSTDWTTFNGKQDALGYTPENVANKSNSALDSDTTKYPTNNAVKTYVDGIVVGLWDDRGSFSAAGGSYPSTGGSGTAGAILKGDIWTISVAGTLPTGQVVEIGDTVRALVDSPGNTQSNWAIQQNNIGYVPANSTLTISTNSPLSGGGDLSTDRTLSISDAAADGTTKGAATFTASDFNSASGVISLDYTNAQAASSTLKGFLTAADWTTFNGKQDTITLTTTGSSGAATFITNTLNIPTYTLSGLGGVSTSRQLTINGTAYDLTADRSWSVGTVTSVAELTLGTTGTDISSSVATGTSTPVITLNVPTASALNRGALSSADWTTFNGKVATTRTISTTSPLSGGGDLSSNLTLGIAEAVADSTTKGVATFDSSDFNSASGVISIDYTNAHTASSTLKGFLTSADWTTFNDKVATTRTISTTAPLSGGGDLSANRTLSITDAAADGTTKGAATFTASDFNATAGVISIDYTNGQAASASAKGFLTSSDWTTFNNKLDSTIMVAGTGTGSTIRDGNTNTAACAYSTVSGGCANTVSSCYSVISGGNTNSIATVTVGIYPATAQVINGGTCNRICATSNSGITPGGNTISGGLCNVINTNSNFSVITGGQRNTLSGNYAVLSGGCGNTASGYGSILIGGLCNTASGYQSFIGTGFTSTASGFYSTIVGGGRHTASGCYSSILGGRQNTTSGRYSTIVGGHYNTITGATLDCSRGSFIGGGHGHNNSGGTINATTGKITGTVTCCNVGAFSTIGGGLRNCATSDYSAILGGRCNNASTYADAMIIGSCITATKACTTHVNSLNIVDTPTTDTASLDALSWDPTSKEVKSRNINGIVYAMSSQTVFI